MGSKLQLKKNFGLWVDLGMAVLNVVGLNLFPCFHVLSKDQGILNSNNSSSQSNKNLHKQFMNKPYNAIQSSFSNKE